MSSDVLNAVLADILDVSPGQYTVLGRPGRAPRYPVSDPEILARSPDTLIKRALFRGPGPGLDLASSAPSPG